MSLSLPPPHTVIEIAPKHKEGLRVDLHSGNAVARNKVLLWNAASVNTSKTQKFHVVPSAAPVTDEEREAFPAAVAAVCFVPVAAPATAIDTTTPPEATMIPVATKFKQCHIMPSLPSSSSSSSNNPQRFLLVPSVPAEYFHVVVAASLHSAASSSSPPQVWEVNGSRGMGAELIVATIIKTTPAADNQLFRFVVPTSPSSSSPALPPSSASKPLTFGSNPARATGEQLPHPPPSYQDLHRRVSPPPPPSFPASLVAPDANSTTARAAAAGYPGDGDIVEIQPKIISSSARSPPELRVDLFSSKAIRGNRVLLWTAGLSRSQRFKIHYRGVIRRRRVGEDEEETIPIVSFVPMGLLTASLDNAGGGNGKQCIITDTDEDSPNQAFVLEKVEKHQDDEFAFQIVNKATGEALWANQNRGMGAELVCAGGSLKAGIPGQLMDAQLFRFIKIAQTTTSTSASSTADELFATQESAAGSAPIFVGSAAAGAPAAGAVFEQAVVYDPRSFEANFVEQEQDQKPQGPPVGYLGQQQ